MVLDFEVKPLRDDVVRVLRPSAGRERARTAYELYLQASQLDENPATMDEAERLYRQAIELDPWLAIAYTNLGNIRFRRHDPTGRDALPRALEIDAKQPEAQYNLGYVMLDRDKPDQRFRCFGGAIGADPSFADAYFNLAMAYEQVGDTVQGATVLEDVHRARAHGHLDRDRQAPSLHEGPRTPIVLRIRPGRRCFRLGSEERTRSTYSLLEIRDHEADAVRALGHDRPPRIDDHPVTVGGPPLSVSPPLTGGDHPGLALDSAGSQQRVPVVLTRLQSERRGNEQRLGPLIDERPVELRDLRS